MPRVSFRQSPDSDAALNDMMTSPLRRDLCIGEGRLRHVPGVMGCLGILHVDLRGKRTLDLDVHFPIDAYDALSDAFGHAAPNLETGPNVVLIRADVPRRPQDESTTMADAALRLLEALIEGGKLRIDPRLARRVEALAGAIPLQPLHVSLDAPDFGPAAQDRP